MQSGKTGRSSPVRDPSADAGFAAAKMKPGPRPKKDVALAQAQALRDRAGPDFRFMGDANRCRTTSHAFYAGRARDELEACRFEEPIDPEDHDGCRELRAGLRTDISGREAEFNRWGWRAIFENRGLDIARPEVCARGRLCRNSTPPRTAFATKCRRSRWTFRPRSRRPAAWSPSRPDRAPGRVGPRVPRALRLGSSGASAGPGSPVLQASRPAEQPGAGEQAQQ